MLGTKGAITWSNQHHAMTKLARIAVLWLIVKPAHSAALGSKGSWASSSVSSLLTRFIRLSPIGDVIYVVWHVRGAVERREID